MVFEAENVQYAYANQFHLEKGLNFSFLLQSLL